MKKHIPNIITCFNLICGTCAVILALWGLFHQAFCFILAAAVFDFMDGACARALKAYSIVGRELDSLSDLVSFGLAPALMMFNWYYRTTQIPDGNPSILAFAALLIVPFSALRLAKFNCDNRQTHSFLGLPTPGCAMIAASLVSYADICSIRGLDTTISGLASSAWFIPVLAVVLSILLITEIPMFSGKEKMNLRHYVFAGCAVVIAVLAAIMQGGRLGFFGTVSLIFLLLFCCYILISILIPAPRTEDPAEVTGN